MYKEVTQHEYLKGGRVRIELVRNGVVIHVVEGAFTFPDGLSPNTITNVGKAAIAGCLIAAVNAPSHIAIGSGTPSATALGSEQFRASAARSQVTTVVTNDTAQYEYVFSFAGSYSITEAGLFNASSGPTMVCSQSFTAVEVVSGDSLKVTWKLQA